MHLLSCSLTRDAVYVCPLSPQDCRASHLSFQVSNRSCSDAMSFSIRNWLIYLSIPDLKSLLLLSPHWCELHSRSISQSSITSWKCKLAGTLQVFRVPFGTGPMMSETKIVRQARKWRYKFICSNKWEYWMWERMNIAQLTKTILDMKLRAVIHKARS